MSIFLEKRRLKYIGWTNEIPKHWSLQKLKFISSLNMGQSADTSDYSYNGIGTPFLQGKAEFGLRHPQPCIHSESAKKFALKEDILLSVRAPVGELNIADQKYGIGRGLCSITPLVEVCDRDFIRYFLELAKVELLSVSTGSTYEAVTIFQVANVLCIIPPLHEQSLIASFLDRETIEIDNLVAEKEKMLALLEEKREALISHAVSSKENENQGNCCLKFLTSKVGSGKTPRGGSEIYSKSGVMLIRSQNVHFAGLRLDDVVFISEEIDEDMKNTRVKSGDVLLNITGASLGRCTVVTPDFPPANVNQHVSIIRCIDKMLIPQYLCYTLQGAEIRNKIWAYENGSSREGLNFEQIASFSIRVISLEQQQKIIDYLDKETTKTDGLLGAIRESIALLKERRSALITAAVTGQISIEEMTT